MSNWHRRQVLELQCMVPGTGWKVRLAEKPGARYPTVRPQSVGAVAFKKLRPGNPEQSQKLTTLS